jgi:hypothetical protein
MINEAIRLSGVLRDGIRVAHSHEISYLASVVLKVETWGMFEHFQSARMDSDKPNSKALHYLFPKIET